MITSVHEVLLALVKGSDTVNDWRNKTNAIIDFLNKTPISQLPQVVIADEPPFNQNGWLWFNTVDMTLMTKLGGAWFPFHQVYAYEMKFYKQDITKNKLIPAGYNAMSVSPKIADGIIVQVSEDSIWKIV